MREKLTATRIAAAAPTERAQTLLTAKLPQVSNLASIGGS
jgi:hypothetical protein